MILIELMKIYKKENKSDKNIINDNRINEHKKLNNDNKKDNNIIEVNENIKDNKINENKKTKRNTNKIIEKKKPQTKKIFKKKFVSEIHFQLLAKVEVSSMN